MVNFCDVETKSEFRLVTNLPDDADAAVLDDEIRDIAILNHYQDYDTVICNT
jgi:hypothetical protein